MFESSFSTGPISEKLRRNLQTPFSLIITPNDESNLQKLDVDFHIIPRCSKCQAYYSNYCTKADNSWNCPICYQTNKELPPEKLNITSENYEFDNQEDLDSDILVLYLSLSFIKEDIDIIRPIIINYLKSLKNRNLMILLGTDESPLTLLAPYMSLFTVDNGILKLTDTPSNFSDFGSIDY